MHQPTDIHLTAKDLSQEESKLYRKSPYQHLQDRKVDEELLQRAWHTAHRIAAILYEDFGATQIAVFGSLPKRIRSQNGRILTLPSGVFRIVSFYVHRQEHQTSVDCLRLT